MYGKIVLLQDNQLGRMIRTIKQMIKYQ